MYEIGTILENLTEKELEEVNDYITQRGDSYLIGIGPNKYGIADIRIFNNQKREKEIFLLKNMLKSTDYCVIKCMESGLSMADTYPEIHQKRTEARARINELEALIAAESTSEKS